jgi:hypothetical protein
LLKLSTASPDATSYYTTTGTTPTTSSTKYMNPFTFIGPHGSSVKIKAFAVKPGMTKSEVVTFV